MKLSRVVIVCLIYQLINFSLSLARADYNVKIRTGSTSGVYYASGAEICYLINNDNDLPAINCIIDSTEGSVFNINAISGRTHNIGIVQSDVAYRAWNKQNPFTKEHKKLRALASLHLESMTLFAHKDSKINSLFDIHNKKIFIGSKKSGTRRTVQEILLACKIDINNFHLVETKPQRISNDLKEGIIDAAFSVVGHPSTQVKSITDNPKNKIIPIEGKCINDLIKRKKFFVRSSIPELLYRGLNHDITTIGMNAILITSTDLPNKVARKIRRVIKNNFNELKKNTPALSVISIDSIMNETVVPNHNHIEDVTINDQNNQSRSSTNYGELSRIARAELGRIEDTLLFWNNSKKSKTNRRSQILVMDQINSSRKLLLEACPQNKNYCSALSTSLNYLINPSHSNTAPNVKNLELAILLKKLQNSSNPSLRITRKSIRLIFNELENNLSKIQQNIHKSHKKKITLLSNIGMTLGILLIIGLMLYVYKQKQTYKDLEEKNKKIKRENEVRVVLGKLLKTAFDNLTIESQLREALMHILAINWNLNKQKGCIFIINEETKELDMMAQIGLPPILLKKCKSIKIGECLCGKSAQEHKIIFANRVNAYHIKTFKEMEEHGHYCIPIMSGPNNLGVLNLYVKKGQTPSTEEQNFLTSISEILAELIERKRAEQKLKKSALTDPLTGLANRDSLYMTINYAISEARRYRIALIILNLDLNLFKNINDELGHEAGDATLCEFTRRTNNCLRKSDLLARVGGDEFVCLLKNLDGTPNGRKVAQKIITSMQEPFYFKGNKIQISVSIGIAAYPEDGESFDQLAKNADIAMYRAKQQFQTQYKQTNSISTGIYFLYNKEMSEEEQRRKRLNNALLNAITKKQFVLYYQPLLNTNGRIVGAEALIRWIRSTGEIMSPAEWIPFAEKSGLIVHIGEWVLEEACRFIAELNNEQLPKIFIAANVSGEQLKQPNFINTVITPITKHKILKDRLEIEITESIPIEDDDLISKIRELRRRGITVAQDDFGTGYANFTNFLNKLFNKLKIDKRYIDLLPEKAHFILGLIGLAHPSGAKIVAEGIETEEQLAILVKLKCDLFQGYFCSKPITAEQLKKLLREKPTQSLECWINIKNILNKNK